MDLAAELQWSADVLRQDRFSQIPAAVRERAAHAKVIITVTHTLWLLFLIITVHPLIIISSSSWISLISQNWYRGLFELHASMEEIWELRQIVITTQLCQSYVLGTRFLCGVKHLIEPVYPAGQQSVEARQVELQHASVERDVCCRWILMVLLSSEVQIKVCEENVQQLQQSVMEHDYSWNTHTYTYNACKSLEKLHCSHTSNSLYSQQLFRHQI